MMCQDSVSLVDSRLNSIVAKDSGSICCVGSWRSCGGQIRYTMTHC
jgi:hypothetical protein